jgi:hypothetical protein
MTWNDRVVRTTEGEEESFAIYEVYYDDDGRPEARTKESAHPAGEDLRYYQAAMQEAVLEETIFQRPTGELFGANES